MFGSRSESAEKAKRDKSRAIVLDDLNIRKYATTVRRLFYPVWPEHPEWRFVFSPGNPWAWACDFDEKTIFVSRQRYPEKDLLRTALIVQIAHARSGVNSPTAWFAELSRAQSIAESIGREQIVCFLGELMNEATADCLDIRRCQTGERLESYIKEPAPTGKTKSANMDSVSTFQDSLQLGYMERQLDQAALALRRLGLKA